jgi:hypothetical protein
MSYGSSVTALVVAVLLLCPVAGLCQGEVLEFFCHSCGYRAQFFQGSDRDDLARNIQHIVVVCERNKQVRNVQIPIDPDRPIHDAPLAAKQYGMGTSRLLGVKLPKFMVPGNTCALFPVGAYLEANICPVDGSAGFEVALLNHY